MKLRTVGDLSFSAQVFEGHPFMIEAGLSLGGKDVKQVSSCVPSAGKAGGFVRFL